MAKQDVKLPHKYWVVVYEEYNSNIRGGFNDVIYTTDNLKDAVEVVDNFVNEVEDLGRTGYIYNIYTKEYLHRMYNE